MPALRVQAWAFSSVLGGKDGFPLEGRNEGLTASVGVFLSSSNSIDNYQMLGIVNQVDYSPGTDTHSV